ncbi:glycosyltransferase family 39 protein [Pararhizobium arenae]|uniref:glycosyltransferase family 39 protein n=1 Tax=Pararhizobium arenae TaxID=1856850 RepID=UPI000A8EDDB1|nr:glycosyltransferase family 39 protein [Pararhizobium arenae]
MLQLVSVPPPDEATSFHSTPSAVRRVSVIVPTLNELENIDHVLLAITAQERHDLAFEILVADGGSTDGTQDRVRQWEASANVSLIQSDGKRGLAGDVLDAALLATSDVIVVMDADLSHPADRLLPLVEPVLNDMADMAIGSRYVPGGETPGWPMHRRLLSRLGGLLARPLTDVRDPMSGFFAVKRERLLAIDPQAAGFKIGLEIIAAGGGTLRTTEVPIAFIDRTLGHSKIGLSQLFAYLQRLVVLAGGRVSARTVLLFALTGLIGIGVDFLIFQILRQMGMSIAIAHIISFAAATISNLLLGSRWLSKVRERSGREWLILSARYFAICLLALFIRGGILAGLTSVDQIPVPLAMLAAIGVASAVNFIGSTLFVWQPRSPQRSGTIRWRITALGIIAYVVILRLTFIGVVDLIPQEAYYWNYAQHLDIGYLDHPPMVAWLIWSSTAIFGDTEFGVRIMASLCWAVAALFTFRLTLRLFDATTAIISLMLLATMPFFFSIGFVMTPDAPLTAAWAGTLYFLHGAIIDGRARSWYGAAACIGIGMLSKYTIALLDPAALAVMIVDPDARRWFTRPHPYLAACLALLIFSPVIYWNIQNGLASFAFQSTDRLAGEITFNLPVLLINASGLLTPIGLTAALAILVYRLREIGDADERRRNACFTVGFLAVPFGIFVIASFLGDTKLNWTGPVWLMAIPSMAAAIVALAGQPTRFARTIRHVTIATIAICLLLFGLALNLMAFGPVLQGNLSLPKQPVAWSEFGRQVASIRDAVERETGRKPILVAMDKYNMASELAFYARENEQAAGSVGRGVIGQPSLMYGRWYRPEDFQGRDAILLSFDTDALNAPAVARHFDALGDLQQRVVLKDGQWMGLFRYRIGYGLKEISAE